MNIDKNVLIALSSTAVVAFGLAMTTCSTSNNKSEIESLREELKEVRKDLENEIDGVQSEIDSVQNMHNGAQNCCKYLLDSIGRLQARLDSTIAADCCKCKNKVQSAPKKPARPAKGTVHKSRLVINDTTIVGGAPKRQKKETADTARVYPNSGSASFMISIGCNKKTR